MAISIIDHTAKLTSKVVGTFKEEIPVKSGFSMFFPEETTPSLEVDIEVERDNDFIAADVARFTEGNANKATKSTEKKYIPPFFNEEYFFQRDQVYMNYAGQGILTNAGANKLMVQRATKNLMLNRKKIQRAILKQMSQVLQTGIITLKNGDNIDYKRQAASIQVLTGGDLWSASSTATPIDDLRAGVKFLREKGRSGAAKTIVVMSEDAYAAFLATDQVKTTAEYRRIEQLEITMPELNEATGMTFQGRVAAGPLVIDLYTYDDFYTDETTGDPVYYLDRNNIVMLPADFSGKTVFGGLVDTNTGSVDGTSVDMPTLVEAKYLVRSFSDKRTISSGLQLMSAPLVVPFSIDKIYTLQVTA